MAIRLGGQKSAVCGCNERSRSKMSDDECSSGGRMASSFTACEQVWVGASYRDRKSSGRGCRMPGTTNVRATLRVQARWDSLMAGGTVLMNARQVSCTKMRE